MVTFNVSFDFDYLKDFTDIFGSMEGFDSIEDITLYIRAFSSYFNWTEMAIDTPDQYLCSKEAQEGFIYTDANQIANYSFDQLALQDSTYFEGLIYLHKHPIALGMNDQYSYNLPDGDTGGQYDPLTLHLYPTVATPIPTTSTYTLASLTGEFSSSDLEPTSESILSQDYRFYATVDFYSVSGDLVQSFNNKEIIPQFNSGTITIENDTIANLLPLIGPGISTIKIQVQESEYFAQSPVINAPLEILPPEYTKFGEKNTKIDLIDPMINSWAEAFDGEVHMPFESNYPHLMGTLWIDADFWGTSEDKERSIQDYIEVNLMGTIGGEDGLPSTFPIREGIMLRPVNREGLMMFNVGLGPEDQYLMGLSPLLNLSFSIDYSQFEIYEDERDVSIYLIDLRLEANPSSNTPDTIWSLYENQLSVPQGYQNLLNITYQTGSITTPNVNLTLGGIMNDEIYGLELDYIYDSETVQYAIADDSTLLSLFNLTSILPMKIIGEKDEQEHVFTDWTTPYPSSEDLSNQSAIVFGSEEPDLGTEFTVIYNFTFNFNNDKHYAQIDLGFTNHLNESWIAFDLKEGFLPPSEDSKSAMFVRYNQTCSNGFATYLLDFTTSNPDIDDFVLYNEAELKNIGLTTISIDGVSDKLKLTFASNPTEDFNVIYGVKSEYLLGYGFQKEDKSYSDSIRLMYNNQSADEIKQGSITINSATLEDPSLYVALDNSPKETVIELYQLPLLYAPEINASFVLDPIITNQIQNYFTTEVNNLKIQFYYVASGGYGAYYTDSIEIALNYTELEADLIDEAYTILYNKDLQGIYDAFGTGNLDVYVSFSQVGNNSNYISYVIMEEFDYLCDEHLSEMYDIMPLDSEGNLDAQAIVNTPHFTGIFTNPLIDGTGYGESPFDLMEGTEVTVGIEDMIYSSLVSLDVEGGEYGFNYLGSMETFAVSSENYYQIPNLALYTDAYDLEETVYQDGFVSLYYGSGTESQGEYASDMRIYMDYEDAEVDDYYTSITSGVPDSWQDEFNITDQFLTTQEITVSGSVLYHQLFDLTNDVISSEDITEILEDIANAEFAVQLPDDVSIAQVRTAGKPYIYDLSAQGFPIGSYVDETYCNPVTSGTTRDFDTRATENIMNSSTYYSLEFASNGSKYIVFYEPIEIVSDFADNNLIMVDYWSYHTFVEGFDYDIIEDPIDPFMSVIDWDYTIQDINTYSMHPDFVNGSSFTIDYASLDWADADDTYIFNAVDEFEFQPEINTNYTLFYESGEVQEDFSILNVVPDNQFDRYYLMPYIYVSVWENEDESTIKTEKLYVNALTDYLSQDVNTSFYFTIDYANITLDLDSGYEIVPDSYVYVSLRYDSVQTKYQISHTPFNYDYTGTQHQSYHVKLTIGGSTVVYSYDTTEFAKYVNKIENNYIYFTGNNYTEEGYIANNTNIKVEYKFKLQPGLLERKHFMQVIYPWSNVFDSIWDGAFSSSTDESGMYREKYRKLSGSSIISPFEYSLSINDTYSLYLSYRLNQREYFEEKFTVDYRSNSYEYTYMPDNFDSYVLELEQDNDFALTVYYFDQQGAMQFLDRSHYTIDQPDHKVILHNDDNVLVTPNDISDFWVSFVPQLEDKEFKSYKFSYDPSVKEEDMEETLSTTYWSVINGDILDVIPNLQAFYFLNEEESNNTNYVCHASQVTAFLEEGEILSFNLTGELGWFDSQLLDSLRNAEYLTLYMNAAFENYELLDTITFEVRNSGGVEMYDRTISVIN